MIIETLSLWEPYAWAMVNGHKKNETRHWPTDVRGWVAIYATKKPFKVESVSPAFQERIWADARFSGNLKFQFGKIVGFAHFVDCRPTEQVKREGLTRKEEMYGIYDDGRFAFITDKVIKLGHPIPWKSRQGKFIPWDMPDELAEQLGVTSTSRVKTDQAALFRSLATGMDGAGITY